MLECLRNPAGDRMTWFNFKHAFLIGFASFKIISWVPCLWDTLAAVLIVLFSYWFGFVTYRWLKRYNLAFQVASYKKAVLITGCDSGFGNMLARKLATERGFQVLAGCLHPEGADSLKLSNVPNVEVFKLDVTSDEDMKNSLSIVTGKLHEAGNDLWAVVCNAGISELGELEWQRMESVQKMFDVNVMGTVRTVKTFLPLLRTSKGRVVITASVLSRVACPGLVAYSMSKAALASLGEGLKRELAVWDVDVCTVEPVLYSTNIIKYQECREEFMNRRLVELPEAVRIDYGEEYFRTFWDSNKAVFKKITNKHPEEAVNMLSHAITTVWPEAHYRIGTTKQLFFYNLLDYLPSDFVDSIITRAFNRKVEPNAVVKS